jgi:hypothetical protein
MITVKKHCPLTARIMLTLALLAMTTAYAATPALDPDYFPVNVNGMNYSGDSIVFGVKNPDRKRAESGGNKMEAYRQAGVQCCYELPQVWRPGIRASYRD